MKIIAGPCQHESLGISLDIADFCRNVCEEYGIDYYFKASYDKANRTHFDSPRGPGLISTLQDFKRMKAEIWNLKILTDFHSVEDIDFLMNELTLGIDDSVDVIQVPALLSRQTDIIREASRSGKIVNIKKGQFMAPWDIHGVMSKLKDAREVWVTERGTSFGYNRLVVDFSGLNYMLRNFDNVVFDATHSVQTPSSDGIRSGGNRNDVPGLIRAAAALGVENFFMEVHPNPDSAPSDGPNSVRLEDFPKIVDEIMKINGALKR